MESFARDDVLHRLLNLVYLVCLYLILVWIYNLTLHPLAKYPGPLSWRASRLANLRAAWSGRYPYIVQQLHQEYGDIVRVGPNELSVASPSAWDDIYSNRGENHQLAYPKSEVWHGDMGPKGTASSIFTTLDFKEHSGMRRYLEPAFTERAALQQEPILQQYADLCVERIKERIASAPSKRGLDVDIVQWLNFYFFDVIGDLAFGESFKCLEDCQYEDWMSSMNGVIKAHYFIISVRHYPMLYRLLMRLMPKSIKKQQEDHHNRAAGKVERRLKSTVDRPDIVSQMLQSKDGKTGLTMNELLENSKLFIIAGSETTATVLSGTLHHMLETPTSLKQLQEEIRQQFASPDEITLAALKKLEYLDAVIHEGLRMCNPNPIGHMRITPPQGGTVAGHQIPGNTVITVHPQTMSFSPDNFHDPQNWHPERWLPSARTDTTSPFHNDNLRCVRTFGWGPQNCIGEPLAWAEMRLLLAKLFWAFDMEIGDGQSEGGKGEKWNWRWEDQNVFAVVEKRGLWVKISGRTR